MTISALKGQGASEALVEKLTRQVRDGKITMDQALEQVRQDAVDRTTAAELRSRKQLEQGNDRLRERVSALKAQMKPTEQKTVRKADTDRVSRERESSAPMALPLPGMAEKKAAPLPLPGVG